MMDTVVKGLILSSAAAWSWVSGIHVLAQVVPSSIDIGPFASFLEKGGTPAVLVLVLWSYRRDYVRLAAEAERRAGEEAERSKQLIALLEKGALASEHVAISLSENNEVLRQVSSQLHDAASIATTTAAAVIVEAAKTAAATVLETARAAAKIQTEG